MSKRVITVGHSPDPDDAFMFYALAHDKIDTGDLTFRHELQDIETLNRRALKGELEVSAVSIHAYAFLLDRYALLPSGCSMGDRYGPMVIARNPMALGDLASVKIAIPGTMTTAFLALRLLLPQKFEYEVVPFDEIIHAATEEDLPFAQLYKVGGAVTALAQVRVWLRPIRFRDGCAAHFQATFFGGGEMHVPQRCANERGQYADGRFDADG